MLKNYIRETGIYLLLFMSSMFILSSLLFFVNIGISVFHLPLSLVLSGLGYYLLRRKESLGNLFKVIGLSLVVVLVSILIGMLMFDRSSDGNTYHKDAVGVLKEGFNPVYGTSLDFIEESRDGNLTQYYIWIDHYAKANWIIGSNFYALTNNVESGKAMNIISMWILFSFLFTSLVKLLDNKKAAILSLIVVFNPITVAQIFTYYNDFLVLIYLFLAILFLIRLDKDINEKEVWLYFSLVFILLSNFKFNGLGYLMIFSFIFCLRFLYKAYKNKEFLILFKKLALIFIPLFIISFLVVGYPTYTKNFIDHGNPFFPLYDKNGEDIISAQQPEKFLKMNTLQKLYYGTFSKVNNLREHDNTEIKVPFSINRDEITPAMSVDTRISGWGLLFSGLLLVSLFVLVRYYKEYKKETVILFTLSIMTLLLLVMSESWWARYTPHFYLTVIFSLYILFKYSDKKWFTRIFVFLIILNTLIPFIGNSYYTLTTSLNIHKTLRGLRNKEIVVDLRGNHGIIYNLKDYNIKYDLDNIEGNSIFYDLINYEEQE